MKIWTAEDPVEITQPGLRQVQVQPKIGFTFAAAMRAFLRADPDVIMVGEMRDHETAATGVEASLTGHLVLSTLHTNSAPETITRLLDMEHRPVQLRRRAARRPGPAPGPHALQGLQAGLRADPGGVRRAHRELRARALGPAGRPLLAEFRLHRPKGCAKCGGSGYKGRMGLHELLIGTDPIKRLIQKRETIETIRRQAMAEGMTTLLQDGIVKVVQGHTDFQQVRAVCMK